MSKAPTERMVSVYCSRYQTFGASALAKQGRSRGISAAPTLAGAVLVPPCAVAAWCAWGQRSSASLA